MQKEYSVKNISPALIDDIKQALLSVKTFGSVELFVQGGSVTQITTRSIVKTKAGNATKKSR